MGQGTEVALDPVKGAGIMVVGWVEAKVALTAALAGRDRCIRAGHAHEKGLHMPNECLSYSCNCNKGLDHRRVQYYRGTLKETNILVSVPCESEQEEVTAACASWHRSIHPHRDRTARREDEE